MSERRKSVKISSYLRISLSFINSFSTSCSLTTRLVANTLPSSYATGPGLGAILASSFVATVGFETGKVGASTDSAAAMSAGVAAGASVCGAGDGHGDGDGVGSGPSHGFVGDGVGFDVGLGVGRRVGLAELRWNDDTGLLV